MKRWEVLAGWGFGSGVELGVHAGRTFAYLLANTPVTLWGVDTWEPQPEKDSEEGGRSYKDHPLSLYEKVVRAVADQYPGRAHVLKMKTTDAADLFADNSVDFVFIDADHTYGGVKADILAWRDKARVLTGHDANNDGFPGVAKALDELCPGWTEHPDHVWRWERPWFVNRGLVTLRHLDALKAAHARKGPLGPHKGEYGITGHWWAPRVKAYAEATGARTILDYGAGKGRLGEVMNVANYDPVTFPEMPENADLVVCTDIMFHVEPQCVDNVIAHIRELGKNVFFVIPEHPEEKRHGHNYFHRSNAEWERLLRKTWPNGTAEIDGIRLVFRG